MADTSSSARLRRHPIVLLLAMGLLSLSGCQWLLPYSGQTPIVVRAQSITLTWDAKPSLVADQPSSIDHHRIYYRQPGSLEWRFLHATRDSRPVTTIGHWELAYGSYEFGVQEVYRSGRVSQLHASSDYTAWPSGGWYVVWQEP